MMPTNQAAKVTFMGTGTSHGVPMIGCDCGVCTSSDPRDKRTRPSVLVETAGKTILIDTPPELRLQCVANDVRHLDAVFFTHAHADHVMGMDDLRRFNWLSKSAIDCYGSKPTLDAISKTFAYIFDGDCDYPSYKPSLNLHPIDDAPVDIGGASILPIPLMHGPLPVLGYRFGNIAYCTDCNVIPPDSMKRLQNLDVLILDALRDKPHPTHFNLVEAVAMAARIGAKQTYFTHIAHALGHKKTNENLPAGMALAYDGQVVQSPL
ncbi:MAG: MBL fold metallo-hydrolase [Planctomycetes bacterium]|nr:MBL fold metallo-hydrolase [Planctomycetota bacterium]